MGTISDMAIPHDVARDRVRVGNYLTRIVSCLLGLGAVAWGAFTLPLFWQEATPGAIAAKIVQGQTYKMYVLSDEARQAEAAQKHQSCNPAASHNLVVLRLAILNGAIAEANNALVASARGALNDATRTALSCEPTNSFAWLTLFWLNVRQRGLTPEDANYLRLSYALGSNEGGIALWRNKLAVALFERLPVDLSDAALDEFVRLVNTRRLTWEAAAIFERASPVVQSRIVEHLKTANASSRQAFAKILSDQGLDVVIPGVERPRARPWEFRLPPVSVQ